MSERESYRRPPRGHMASMMVDKPKSMKKAISFSRITEVEGGEPIVIKE